MRTLFVYPNLSIAPRAPLAITILCAVLRANGHETLVFDPTFMNNALTTDYKRMEANQVVKKTKLDELIGEIKEADVHEELLKTIEEFQPDLIAHSLLERNYITFKDFISVIHKHFPKIPNLVGGILPTIYPDLLVNDPMVDWICVGEGENLLKRMGDLWPDVSAIENLPGLWFKNKEGNIIKNTPDFPVDVESVPEPDYSGFDDRHMLAPFEGEVYLRGSVEWSRGCLSNCSFCVGPALRNTYSTPKKQYHRTKSVPKLIQELIHKKERYNLQLMAFCDTNFIQGIPLETLREFVYSYKKEINLPFIIQTGSEYITEEKLGLLIEAGCVTASIGVESGSEFIRKKVLKKGPSKKKVREVFDLCRKMNFRVTANYMIGLPFETEEHVWETIRFNRELNPPSIAVTYFSPFLGTRLYDLCMEQGFYKGFDPHASVYDTSPLIMPQFPTERIREMVKIFTDDFNTWKQEADLKMDVPHL